MLYGYRMCLIAVRLVARCLMHNNEIQRVDSPTIIIAAVPELPIDACLDLYPVLYASKLS